MSPRKLSRKAIVKNITEKEILVEICSADTCGSCHSKSACSMFGGESLKTAVVANRGYPLSVGDQVCISIKRSAGVKALFAAYIVPIIVIIVTLLILQSLETGELKSGLVTLGVLALYYMVLRLFRSKLDYGIIVELEPESSES